MKNHHNNNFKSQKTVITCNAQAEFFLVWVCVGIYTSNFLLCLQGHGWQEYKVLKKSFNTRRRTQRASSFTSELGSKSWVQLLSWDFIYLCSRPALTDASDCCEKSSKKEGPGLICSRAAFNWGHQTLISAWATPQPCLCLALYPWSGSWPMGLTSCLGLKSISRIPLEKGNFLQETYSYSIDILAQQESPKWTEERLKTGRFIKHRQWEKAGKRNWSGFNAAFSLLLIQTTAPRCRFLTTSKGSYYLKAWCLKI